MAPHKQARASSRDTGARQAYNGVVREQLADLQRARIVSATFDVVAQRGAGSVTVAHVVERSGVSRRTFYENFDDREDCLLASFERAVTLASDRVIPAYEVEKGWREQIRAGLVAFLAFCDEQPSVAQMLVCESQASGPRVARRRTDILARLTRIVDQGRNEGKAENVSPLAAEGTIGGVLAVIQARLTDAKRKPLVTLTNELASMIVLTYFGAPAARRELKRATPKRSSEAIERTMLGDPFKEAGMRLTYRTVRVLMAIAELGGRDTSPSNRLIADTAEIADQGQISKLLGRLQRAGMLTNTGLGAGTGAPNAWTLTDRGWQVTDSIRLHTEGSQNHGAHER
ncbi:MAG: TetR/AcrR family transcriptional regulator [Solirubrobacteraceae bacterium]